MLGYLFISAMVMVHSGRGQIIRAQVPQRLLRRILLQVVAEGQVLGLQRAGPIHAFRGARAHGSFEQARLDEDLFGRQIEFADQLGMG